VISEETNGSQFGLGERGSLSRTKRRKNKLGGLVDSARGAAGTSTLGSCEGGKGLEGVRGGEKRRAFEERASCVWWMKEVGNRKPGEKTSSSKERSLSFEADQRRDLQRG